MIAIDGEVDRLPDLHVQQRRCWLQEIEGAEHELGSQALTTLPTPRRMNVVVLLGLSRRMMSSRPLARPSSACS